MKKENKQIEFADILVESFNKRKAMMRDGKERRKREDLIKRLRERKADEEMIEIAFSPRPMTDDERKNFERVLENTRESGEEILIPKLYNDGRIEFVKYEDIKNS